MLIVSSSVQGDGVCLLAADRFLTIRLSRNKNTPRREGVFQEQASPALATATNIYFSLNRFYFYCQFLCLITITFKSEA